MIFYFSGTGNSSADACFFAKKKQETVVDLAKVLSDKKFCYEIQEGESLGFVFPTYFWGLPTVVVHGLSRLQIKGKPSYVWAVITCGGGTGASDRQLKAVAKTAGLTVDGVFSLRMPDNYVPMFQAPGKEEAARILKEADRKMEEIGQAIERKEKGEKSGVPGLLLSSLMQPLYRNGRRTSKFSVDNSCIGCGQCESVCPVKAIALEGGKPVWKKERCALCMGCLNRCPAEAIQYGKKTKKHGRYVNPVYGIR